MIIKNFLEIFYLILLGFLTTLSLPPYNFFIINFLTFPLLFIFFFRKKIENNNKKIFSFKYGWLFGFGYFLSSLYWISIALTFDETFKFLIPIGLILVPSFLAIFYGVISYFFFKYKSKNDIELFFLFCILFGILEFLRGNILTGFPWNLIAYSFSESIKFIQIISFIGTYSFNLVCISIFSCPALMVLKRSNTSVLVTLFFFLLSIFFYVFGFYQINKFSLIENKKHDFTIRSLATNVKIDRFFSSKDDTEIINELIEISEPNLDKTTIFVWPEGIISNVYSQDIKIYEDLFKEKFNEKHFFLLGINENSIEAKNKKIFNTLALYDHNLNLINSYKKINLVPFGEFIPFENYLDKTGLRVITKDFYSYSAGEKRNIISLNNKFLELKILPLICYEMIYSGKIFNDQKFDFIINISEDGWFGKSIGPAQHFSHSIFRSVEYGKYIIRSSNNGISAIINPKGIIEKSVKFNKSGFIDFDQSKTINQTLFSKYGNKIFIIIILMYIFLIFSFNRIKNE